MAFEFKIQPDKSGMDVLKKNKLIARNYLEFQDLLLNAESFDSTNLSAGLRLNEANFYDHTPFYSKRERLNRENKRQLANIFNNIPSIKVLPTFPSFSYPHQRRAVETILTLPYGGLLADQVGMGKTIEAGMIISELAIRDEWRTLVITTSGLNRSLLTNWKEEMYEKFLLNVAILDKKVAGSKEYDIDYAFKVLMQYQKDLTLKDNEGKNGCEINKKFTKYQGVVVPFEILSHPKFKNLLNEYNSKNNDKFHIDLIVVDESHRYSSVDTDKSNLFDLTLLQRHSIKNGVNVKDGKIILLTATPIKSNLKELYYMMRVINPNYSEDDFKNELGITDSFDMKELFDQDDGAKKWWLWFSQFGERHTRLSTHDSSDFGVRPNPRVNEFITRDDTLRWKKKNSFSYYFDNSLIDNTKFASANNLTVNDYFTDRKNEDSGFDTFRLMPTIGNELKGERHSEIYSYIGITSYEKDQLTEDLKKCFDPNQFNKDEFVDSILGVSKKYNIRNSIKNEAEAAKLFDSKIKVLSNIDIEKIRQFYIVIQGIKNVIHFNFNNLEKDLINRFEFNEQFAKKVAQNINSSRNSEYLALIKKIGNKSYLELDNEENNGVKEKIIIENAINNFLVLISMEESNLMKAFETYIQLYIPECNIILGSNGGNRITEPQNITLLFCADDIFLELAKIKKLGQIIDSIKINISDSNQKTQEIIDQINKKQASITGEELGGMINDIFAYGTKNDKIIIFCKNDAERRRLDNYSYLWDFYDKYMDTKEIAQIERASQNRDSIDNIKYAHVIAIAYEVDAEGINLQSFHHMIHYSIVKSPLAIEQRNGRIDRIGQRNDMNFYFLASTNEVEGYILRFLEHDLQMFTNFAGDTTASTYYDDGNDVYEFEEVCDLVWKKYGNGSERFVALSRIFDQVGERVKSLMVYMAQSEAVSYVEDIDD